MSQRIYLASSWRNTYYPDTLRLLRSQSYEVHDFRDPAGYFTWAAIDPAWEVWTPDEYAAALGDPLADVGYNRDRGGMEWADTCVLLLPCGRSAHLEAGFMAGQGKRVIAYLPEPIEAELMYRLLGEVVTTPGRLLHALEKRDGAA